MLIRGVGLHAPLEATGGLLDVGNSGTLMRLLPGWLAGQPGGVWTLDGDESIRAPPGRPGRRAAGGDGRRASRRARAASRRSRSRGAAAAAGSTTSCRWPSAQVKSCVLIAGHARRRARPRSSRPRRAATTPSGMLRRARVPFERDGLRVDGVARSTSSSSTRSSVPGRPLVGGLHRRRGHARAAARAWCVKDVGLNWTRTGFFRIAERMGAVIVGDLEEPGTDADDEPVGELDVALGPLEGTEVERRRGAAGDRRADAGGAAGRVRRGRDGGARRRGAAPQGVRPHRRRGRGAARPGRGHRGDRRRLRRRAATARRCAAARSTPAATTAWRCSARWPGWPPRRASRWSAWRRPASPTRASSSDLARAAGRLASRRMVVAIDGPAGAGKSTRGARAWRARSASPTSTRARCTAPSALLTLRARRRRLRAAPRGSSIELGDRVLAQRRGRDRRDPRTPEVSEAASRVATNPKVREALVRKQRELLAERRLGGRGPRHRHGRRARRRR